MKILILLTSLLGTLSVQADEWFCSTQCLVVDLNHSWVENLGSVIGTSNYSKSEAWADLVQECKKLGMNKGYQASSISLVSGLYYQHEKQRYEYLNPHFSYGRYARGYFYLSDSIIIEIKFASPNDQCIDPKVLPNGKPKYIGPGRPLG